MISFDRAINASSDKGKDEVGGVCGVVVVVWLPWSSLFAFDDEATVEMPFQIRPESQGVGKTGDYVTGS